MTKITPEQLSHFKTEGYLIIPGFASEHQLNGITKTLLVLLKKFKPEFFDQFSDKELLNNDRFHGVLLDFRQQYPSLFGAVYDCMQVSCSLQGLITSNESLSIVSQLLEDTPESIMSFNYILRMDAPQDSRNVLGWHQDFLSLEEKSNGLHGVTLWIPLHPVSYVNGSIIICPKSHQAGIVASSERRTSSLDINQSSQNELNKRYSDSFYIPEPLISQFKQTCITANTGDAVIFYMSIFHQSGINNSNKFRFTANGRFYRFRSNSFIPGGLALRRSVI